MAWSLKNGPIKQGSHLFPSQVLLHICYANDICANRANLNVTLCYPTNTITATVMQAH